jgi:hypothetical protein
MKIAFKQIILVLGGWFFGLLLSEHLSLVVSLQNAVRNLGEHFLRECSQQLPGNVQTSEDGSDVIRILH